MGEQFETSEGLLWAPNGAIPWACRADRHVYDIRLLSKHTQPPPERPTLKWISYSLEDDDLHLIYVQVLDGPGLPCLTFLEIGGAERKLRGASEPQDRSG